jgi:hypothetical protein
MRPLCIADLQYGSYEEQIYSFGQFLPKNGDFR